MSKVLSPVDPSTAPMVSQRLARASALRAARLRRGQPLPTWEPRPRGILRSCQRASARALPCIPSRGCSVTPRTSSPPSSTRNRGLLRPSTTSLRAARRHDGQPPRGRGHRPRGTACGSQITASGAAPSKVVSSCCSRAPVARVASAAGRTTTLRFRRHQPRPGEAASVAWCSCKVGHLPNCGGDRWLRGPGTAAKPTAPPRLSSPPLHASS